MPTLDQTRVILALGSNLGDRGENLRQALKSISEKVTIRKISSVYETPPWGFSEQPSFFNQVLSGNTSLSAAELLTFVKDVEHKMGRVKNFQNGPRLIDIDILLFGEQSINTESLNIPHPRMLERGFVLLPLSEIEPDLVVPGTKKSVIEFLEKADQTGIHKLNSEKMKSIKKGLDLSASTMIMGILNITPDSFSGDGMLKKSDTLSAVLNLAESMLNDGADILDVGGESTRPGAQLVSMQEELDRVIPVIETLHQRFDVPISVDTYKAKVAEAALNAGAAWINDVWGLRADPHMAEVAAKFNAPVVLMHNRSKPSQADLQQHLGGRYIGVPYENLLEDVKNELLESVSLAHAAGVTDEQLILDPGIGFGKTVEQNLELINRLDEIKALGYPVLLGVSRKSFIGYTLNLPPEERAEGTAAACTIGIMRGANILRVHDVKFMARIAKMTNSILRYQRDL